MGRLRERPIRFAAHRHELVPQLYAPVLGLYAGLDKNITAADIDACVRR